MIEIHELDFEHPHRAMKSDMQRTGRRKAEYEYEQEYEYDIA